MVTKIYTIPVFVYSQKSELTREQSFLLEALAEGFDIYTFIVSITITMLIPIFLSIYRVFFIKNGKIKRTFILANASLIPLQITIIMHYFFTAFKYTQQILFLIFALIIFFVMSILAIIFYSELHDIANEKSKKIEEIFNISLAYFFSFTAIFVCMVIVNTTKPLFPIDTLSGLFALVFIIFQIFLALEDRVKVLKNNILLKVKLKISEVLN